VDGSEFAQAAIRMVRALATRVGGSDIATFGALWELRAETDRAIAEAIDDLHAKGFSYTDLAAETGWTRQGMRQWHLRHGGQASDYDGSQAEDREEADV